MARDILSSLSPAKGSRRKRKRIGRGQGSGRGGTATRGDKGQGSRSGWTYRPWFERGFHSPFKKEFQILNVDTLDKLATDGKVPNGVVTPEVLVKLGAVKKLNVPIKVLGNGELKMKLDVSAHAFSKPAIQKIETAGGKAQTISVSRKE
jgi:large subunit ribosomal protein L15